MPDFFDDTRVTYRNGATINTGNFENVRPEFEITTNVRPGEKPADALKRCEAIVDAAVARKIAELK
jgi:hypothetical protein